MAKTEKYSLRQQQQFDKAIPLLLSTIERFGNIAPLDKLASTYGIPLVNYAASKNFIKKVCCRVSSKTNSQPAQAVIAYHTPAWDSSRPSWVDEYAQ